MKKRNILIASSIAAAGVVAVAIGSFALFSDDTETSSEGTIGSVDVGVSSSLEIENSQDVNPGDEDPDNPYDPDDPDVQNRRHEPTTGHKLSFSITNAGTKSIFTRNVIDIDVTQFYETEDVTYKDADGNETTRKVLVRGDDGNYVVKSDTVYLDPIVCALFANGDDGNYDLVETDGKYVYKFVYEDQDEKGNDRMTLRYVIEGATLNGSVIETEDSTTPDDDTVQMSDDGRTASYTYYLGMDSNAGDEYQGSTITVHLYVQAMQWRNTTAGTYANDGDWVTIYEDVVVAGSTKVDGHWSYVDNQEEPADTDADEAVQP